MVGFQHPQGAGGVGDKCAAKLDDDELRHRLQCERASIGPDVFARKVGHATAPAPSGFRATPM
jgi:hypothetical protein